MSKGVGGRTEQEIWPGKLITSYLMFLFMYSCLLRIGVCSCICETAGCKNASHRSALIFHLIYGVSGWWPISRIKWFLLDVCQILPTNCYYFVSLYYSFFIESKGQYLHGYENIIRTTMLLFKIEYFSFFKIENG